MNAIGKDLRKTIRVVIAEDQGMVLGALAALLEIEGDISVVSRARNGREALEAVAQRLVEREVIEGSELRRLLEEYNPGPKLVPGSLPVAPPVEIIPEKHADGGLSAGAGMN